MRQDFVRRRPVAVLRRAAAFLALLSLFAGAASRAQADIRWRTGPSARRAQTPAEVRAALAELAKDADVRHIVVQFDEPTTPARREALKDAGLTLLSYLADNAFFASLAAGADLDTIAAVRSLIDVRRIERSWKLHPLIIAGAYPPYAVGVDPLTQQTLLAAYVLFHADVAAAEAVRVAQAYGATVVYQFASLNGLVIEFPQAELPALADEDAVQWIEPPLPFMTPVNDSNRVVTQANQAQAAPYNLSGAGVNVLVYDGGYGLASHQDFGGRLTVRDSSGLSNHSTHVAGTIGGSGAASGGTYRGMAPSVIMQSYGFQYDGTGIFLYSNPGDLEQDYNQAINVYGADISNNSIGTNTATNGFPCEITGDYGVTSALIDAIVGGSLGAPFRIVWANGNERQTTRCGNTYATTAPPACAKNHITVGALNSNNDTMTSFSSWGPADDGRMKPDVSAPGCQSDGDGGVTSTSSSGGYTTMCGTSMASPTTCGLAALILEDFRAQFGGQPDPRNSTLKALLAHNAQDRGNAGPDYQFGYGSVRVRDTIDFMRTGNFAEDQVGQGGVVTYQVQVIAGAPELKVTLAWDDAPGTPNVDPALVNDLDLAVFSPSSVRAYPWVLDAGNPANPAVQNKEDHVNNIEQVYVQSPGSGSWTVEVRGFNVPQGPQAFSICASPGFTQEGLFIGLPNGAPSEVPPGTPTTIDVEITAVGEDYVAGSGTFYYRFDGGAHQTSPLTPLGGDFFQATLPAAGCSDTPEYYFSAAGTVSGTVYLPADAPASVFSAVVGETVVVFADNFETDQGWTAENLGATSGDWQRGVPVNDPGWAYDPESDSDGSGQCYLTQNQLGNTDVDNGAVRLSSPTIDLSAGQVTISYDYFLYLTNTIGGVDMLLVEIDSNGGAGPWIEIARHITDGGLSWRTHVIDQAGLDAAGVTMTATMRLRFTANDADPQSINESGLDAVNITAFTCAGGATCNDGVQNQGEDRIDCGGPCPPCECLSDAACDDGLFCDGTETCDAYGQCQAGTPVDCDDAVSCTDDSCNETTDLCDNLPNDANCDNGLYCDGAETCDAVFDCQPGTPVDCDDAVSCTDDSCNETTDLCDNLPNDANCDNGLYCDGAETCDAVLDCQPGTPVDCDDGVACTTDSCNETTDSCDNTPNGADCDDGLFCNGAETCDPLLGCLAGSDPCPGQFCDDVTDTCIECFDDTDCDDGLFCNGAEACVGGSCQAGSDPCPGQACDEVGDICVDCIDDADCDDGLFCNGAESCVGGACQAGSDPCPGQLCDDGTDTCVDCLGDGDCDDGLFCNGAEACVGGACQPGTPVDCDDGVPCTDDTCNESTDTCDNVPNDANCDNGLFCDGAETCDAVQDCQGGTDPCPGQACDEVNDVCSPVACDNNGTCGAGEDCNNCPNDCISGGPGCGNGVCEPSIGEDCRSCPGDCNGRLTGNPNRQFCCGDSVGCGDSRCTDGAFDCSETPVSDFCCGDLVCEGFEDSCDCPIDCGDPALSEVPSSTCDDGLDNDCDGGADCADPDCATDSACQPVCDNDFVCEPGEDCQNCPNDCDGKSTGKPSGRYCCGNGVLEPAEGDGSICDGNP